MSTLAFPAMIDDSALTRAMWSNPDNGLWVARSSEAYLGMVEQTEQGFAVTDERGFGLGIYDDLATAKNIVSMEFGVEDDVPAGGFKTTAMIATGAVAGALTLVILALTLISGSPL